MEVNWFIFYLLKNFWGEGFCERIVYVIIICTYKHSDIIYFIVNITHNLQNVLVSGKIVVNRKARWVDDKYDVQKKLRIVYSYCY